MYSHFSIALCYHAVVISSTTNCAHDMRRFEINFQFFLFFITRISTSCIHAVATDTMLEVNGKAQLCDQYAMITWSSKVIYRLQRLNWLRIWQEVTDGTRRHSYFWSCLQIARTRFQNEVLTPNRLIFLSRYFREPILISGSESSVLIFDLVGVFIRSLLDWWSVLSFQILPNPVTMLSQCLLRSCCPVNMPYCKLPATSHRMLAYPSGVTIRWLGDKHIATTSHKNATLLTL